jgi:hypothetical protein
MRKVVEYQERAAGCRRRAERAVGDDEKKRLEQLAATWELLAKTRQKQLETGDIQPVYSLTRNHLCDGHAGRATLFKRGSSRNRVGEFGV